MTAIMFSTKRPVPVEVEQNLRLSNINVPKDSVNHLVTEVPSIAVLLSMFLATCFFVIKRQEMSSLLVLLLLARFDPNRVLYKY